NTSALQPCGERIERGSVGHLPAEETRTVGNGAVDHDALLAVIHTEGEQRIAAFDRLKSEQVGAEMPPIVELVRGEPVRSESPEHCVSPSLRRHQPRLTVGDNPTPNFGPVHRRSSLDAAALPW